jgi:hypothetical protein
MGVANSCAFDDRLRLSHSALVSALTWVRLPQWVKKRPSGAAELGPVNSQQRTSEDGRSTSEKCQKQTSTETARSRQIASGCWLLTAISRRSSCHRPAVRRLRPPRP